MAFHYALTQIGVGTLEEAIDLWGDVNPAKAAPTAARWLSRAISLVLSRRRMSRDLAFAYYRLARALRTGSTIADPYDPLKNRPTLNDLRREFASMVDDVILVHEPAQSEQAKRTEARVLSGPQAEAPEVPEADEDDVPELPDDAQDEDDDDELDRLLVEEIEGLRELEEELERAAEEEARIALEALGPKTLAKRLQDPKADPEEAHRKSGARQASAAERIVMNGARSTQWGIASKDKRVLGWARVSRTGTPCGFCAMLISRGFTPRSGLYRSKSNAGGQNLGYDASYDDGDLYHDNCHCYAEPIFSVEQYESDQFALNRQYAQEWPKVTKGLGGNDALNAWRRHINRQRSAPVARAA
jgi:hypothetical protein